MPSGSYNINSGVLSAFVVGDVNCNFVTTSLFETINFEGSTAGKKINNAGTSNSCDKCSSLPNVEAKYSAVPPCGAASYQHYGVMLIEYYLPNGDFEVFSEFGPVRSGTVYNYNSPPC